MIPHAAILTWAMLPVGTTPAEPEYLRDVKPIFAAHCYACHGATKQKGDLRLDTAAFMRTGGASGPALVPGDSGDSLLVQRLRGQGKHRMPPAGEGEPLKPAQIAAIRAWIDRGTPAPKDEQPETDPREHWAFRPPVRPVVPPGKNAAWGRNPVDAFIAQQHEQRGLVPQPDAEKSLLLRRVYLDLIGLPPTREEIAAFLTDLSSDAYEKAVEKLLASPHYGERWGRHWMDVWRYSDWWGLGEELRNSQKHMWHWRDWIVESLNADKGYDQLVREMLAADELHPTDADALRGTGFLARHYFKFNRTTWLDETIEHTAKAFLGLTINCAKCHDHKYDPITQADYYRFRAIFEPYQIRLDQVPGQTDFEKDGIPRVFDCNLDAPTYLHVRGNEQNPDKRRAITPGLPKLLAPAGLDIRAIKLPREAHQPGLRPFVVQDHLRAADKQIEQARAELAKARKALDAAKNSEAAPPAAAEPVSKTLVRDSFGSLDPKQWEAVSGDWKTEAGKLHQHADGDVRGVLRLKQEPPADFEARFKFAILGGQQWRSVGVTFDAGDDRETLVYLTAHAGEPRIQVAYKQGGNYVYPPTAKQPRKVELGQPQEMVVRVRGPLLNVSVNGEPVLAYGLPTERKPGRVELITFDAKARFEAFTLQTLPASVVMVEAGPATAKPTLAQAEAMVRAAERAIAAAESSQAAVHVRAAADRDGTKDAIRAAAKAEKQAAVAEAELAVARAEADPAQTAKLSQAKATLEAARKALANPGETYTPLAGALKTLESNLETEASRRKPFPAVSTGRRAALARWVTDRQNPLTARVAVNHVWARHFGQSLVPTVFDFGRKGAPPTHPELLDYLAVELMENGWSLKHLHRLLVTSRTYRMTSSSLGGEASAKADPDNRAYWRMNPARMESQLVRDSLLSLAGDLDRTLGGPSLDPVTQEASRRRSLYFVHSANDRHKFLALFDDADVLDCYRRRESIVPQQALALSNSKLALDLAGRIATRIQGESMAEYVREAFITILAYEPSPEELQACELAMREWQQVQPSRPPAEAQRRARTQLVHALLNHNDFVTIR